MLCVCSSAVKVTFCFGKCFICDCGDGYGKFFGFSSAWIAFFLVEVYRVLKIFEPSTYFLQLLWSVIFSFLPVCLCAQMLIRKPTKRVYSIQPSFWVTHPAPKRDSQKEYPSKMHISFIYFHAIVFAGEDSRGSSPRNRNISHKSTLRPNCLPVYYGYSVHVVHCHRRTRTCNSWSKAIHNSPFLSKNSDSRRSVKAWTVYTQVAVS